MDDLLKVEFREETYYLARELTGKDWLELRKRARDEKGNYDMTLWAHVNLVLRLRSWSLPLEISEETLLEQPLSVYQLLNQTSMWLDSEETKDANDFFLKTIDPSLKVVVPSISEDSSLPVANGSGPSTPSGDTESKPPKKPARLKAETKA